MNRPECAGWHEPDPLCDGDPGVEPPCAYKARCLALREIALARQKKDPALGYEAALELVASVTTEGDLDEILARPSEAAEGLEEAEEALAPPSTPPSSEKAEESPEEAPEDIPPLPPVHDTEGGKVRTARELHPRPEARYSKVLPLVDALAESFARKLGKRLLREGDLSTRPGDLFIRYTPGMQGRLLGLYEATDRGTRRHRLITRIVLCVRVPRFNLKTNISSEKFVEAIDAKPPVGPECRVWNDSKPHVALVGVDAHAVSAASSWLVRCYQRSLIDDVRRRGSKKAAS